MADLLDILPFPIAGPYRLLRLESQPSNGVFRIFDVVEMGIRYLCACVVCEQLAAGDEAALQAWTDKPLSLGAMAAWLRDELKRASSATPLPVAQVLAPLWRKVQTHVEALTAERNRTRGHGVTATERRYRKLRSEIEPRLEAFLEIFRELTPYRPVIVKGLNDFDGSWYEHQVLVALGDNPYFPVEILKSDRPLPFRRVHLWNGDGSLVPLHPFLAYELCPQCDEEHLVIFQSLEKTKGRYVDPLKGCLVTARFAAPGSSGGSGSRGSLVKEPDLEESVRLAASGVMLGGRYLLRRELGRGAGGRVFAGTDQVSGTEVAVKVLEPAGRAAPSSQPTSHDIERFQREARAIAHLKHPGVPCVLDVGVDGALHYMVTELVQGEELAAILRRGAMPLERALRLTADLLEALAVAHEAGVVHRDVKPGNVMVQPDGRIKLLDFGVARLLGNTSITQTAEIVGTAGYLSPEQINGGAVDGRADLFAVGVVLYEMVTGRRPFEAATFQETLSRIVHVEAAPPSRLIPGLPPWLDAAIARLLAKRAADRPATAADAIKLLAPPEQGASPRGRFWIPLPWKRRVAERPDPDHPRPIEVTGLEMRFSRRKRVLTDLSLQIHRGVRYCLLGRNGAGKSTLIRCLMGLHHPPAGEIRILGTAHRRREELNQWIGYIPETPTAYRFLRVGQFLRLLAQLYPSWDSHLTGELLARWDVDPETKIGAMSRGMQTMVSVLAALGHRPPLLLLDDPTIGLDAFWSEGFLETLSDPKIVGQSTILFSTHNFEAAETLADRVGFLDRGRICREIDLKDLPRRFCRVHAVLPHDEEPARLPEPFTVFERKGRSLEGLYEITDLRPQDAFSFLEPVSFEARPPSLKEVYFHVLRRQAGMSG